MNEPKDPEDKGSERDFSDFAGARVPPRDTSTPVSSFLRGCGVALGIAFLLLAFVVGACFISL